MKISLRILFSCLFLMTSSCSSDSEPEQKLIGGIKNLIESQLIDPSSVQYKNIKVDSETFGTIVICGEFNAKNQLGGYTGFKPFIYNGPTRNEVEIEPTTSEYSGWCLR